LLWWKERRHEGGRPLRGVQFLAGCAFLLLVALVTTLPFLIAIGSDDARAREDTNSWARVIGTIVSCFLLLAVAFNAARTISRERTRRTLDSLLATPLENATILHAKTFASVVRVQAGWFHLGWFWLAALASGGIHVLALPLLVAGWFLFAVLAAEIGVWCSLASRNTLRSTIFTLAILAGISVGPPFLGLAYDVFAPAFGLPERSPFAAALWSYGASPPLTLWGLAYSTNVNEPMLGSATYRFIGGLVGMYAYAVIAWLVWRQLVARFGRLTGRMPVVYSSGQKESPMRVARPESSKGVLSPSTPFEDSGRATHDHTSGHDFCPKL
jgi:hypothetical protein